MDERLTSLEINFMHIERNLQELNEVVYRQQQTIDRLVEELQVVKAQVLADTFEQMKKPEDEEPPPHY